MFKEFREFAMKGNVIDMAIGIVIGGVFTPIVQSLVNDLIMPPLGLLTGGISFADKFILLKPGADGAASYATLAAAQEAGAVTINYGSFINVIITFLLVAWAVFMVVKVMNRLKREDEAPAAEPTTKSCPQCAMEIPIAAKRCGHCTSEV
ncbi:MAG: large-conductance mechanosensitive channel protein MscL [Planctomycetales bacterium]|nr:large-conductance mechanosensitive channel protein MscL [bacterium]UNM08785.1 MAG: large-conductance mechanosensitive channel protein MscL [Planctomycetales bacterium]